MKAKNKRISFGFILREQWNQIVHDILSVKIVAVLFIIVCAIIEYWDGGKEAEGMPFLIVVPLSGMWILLLFPFLSRQLILLLPMGEKEKKIYILQYMSAKMLWVLTFYFLLGGAIAVSFHLDYVPWLLGMLRGFPLLLVYNVLVTLGRSTEVLSFRKTAVDATARQDVWKENKKTTLQVLFETGVLLYDFATIYANFFLKNEVVRWSLFGIAMVLSITLAVVLIRWYYREYFQSDRNSISGQEG